tara:strand:- start:810 stop:1847 length:1038 start_codon:yes stop_codon:yes gene_type:complete
MTIHRSILDNWNRFLIEGGLKSKKTQGVALTPQLVHRAVDAYVSMLNQFNSYLSEKGMKPVTPIRPVGSVSYYEQDMKENPNIVYGDIDYLVKFPLSDKHTDFSSEKKAMAMAQSDYRQMFIDFLNEKQPQMVDIKETLKGGFPLLVIIRLSDSEYVQVDTVITFPKYSEWMKTRYKPERGVKGYVSGNLYKALGDYLILSIGTEGVIARVQGGKRVPGKVRKDVMMQNVTANSNSLFYDIAKYLIGKDKFKVGSLMKKNPGVNAEVSIEQIAKGVKGLAETLNFAGLYDKEEMLQAILTNFGKELANSIKKKLTRGTGIDEQAFKKLERLNAKMYNVVKRAFEV